jgi:hypothetical protein
MPDTPPSIDAQGISTMPPQRRLILFGTAGGMIFLALVCIALGIVLVSRSGPGSPVTRATPTLASGPSAPQILSGPGGSIPLTQTAPSAIEIKDHKFDVIPVEVANGTWPYQRDSLKGDKAAWVFGTLINYVIGLDANSNNTTLLQSLTEADLIKMTTLSGRTVTFRYSGRQWVTVDKTDVFRQVRPGLTLVLLGEKGDQRLVVSASYMAENEPTPVGSAMAKVGTTVEVANARVKALSGKLVKNVAGLPAGNAYYQVDFSVTATGSSPLDASLFQMELIDASGKRYTLSIPASQAGSYGPPGGQLLPGTTLTATAGFLVADTLPGVNVIWTFSPQAGSASPARFQLSIAGPTPTPDPRSLVTVQVTGARYSPDGQEILISGGVGNTAKEAVTINLADINLQSGSSLIAVNSTEPALPWVLQPGQNLAFVIHFVRPPAGTATFRMLQRSFELSGLQ